MKGKHQLFIREYLKDYNGRQAAIRAGYAPSSAAKVASELLDREDVSKALAELAKQYADDLELDAKWVLKRAMSLANVDVRSFYDESGALKPVTELDDTQGRQLAALETIRKNAWAGDGQTDVVYKIKFWDKIRALELLAKHLNLFAEQDVNVNLSEETVRIILEGRARNAAAKAEREKKEK